MTGPKKKDNDKYNTFKERSLRLVTFYQSDEKTLTDQQKDNDKGNGDTFRDIQGTPSKTDVGDL